MSKIKSMIDEALDVLKPKDETPDQNEKIVDDTITLGERLAQATELLLSFVPTSIANYARELSDITLKIPRWQLLLGSFMAQYDSGMLPQPHLEPGWRRDESVNEAEVPKATCPYCQHDFIPKRIGQIYHDICGNRVRKAELEERRAKREETLKMERVAAAERMLTERERREHAGAPSNP